MIFRKDGPFEELMGGMIVVTVCLGAVWTSSLLSCDRGQSSLVDETLGEIYDTGPLLEDLSLDR